MIRHARRAMVAMAGGAVVASCVSVGPTWSELTGERYSRTVFDRRPLVIERVDGESAPVRIPVKIPPGRHEITVSSPPHAGFEGGFLATLTLDIQPCQRYYINAQFDNPVQPSYTPVVDGVEAIAGCYAGF